MCEVALQRRAVKRTRFLLAYNDVLWAGRDLRHDDIALELVWLETKVVLADTGIFERPRSLIPAVFAPNPGGVDHRNALCAGDRDQFFDHRDRLPTVLAARVHPALDQFENGLRLVADKTVIDINNEQRRPSTEPTSRAITRRFEDLPIALG